MIVVGERHLRLLLVWHDRSRRGLVASHVAGAARDIVTQGQDLGVLLALRAFRRDFRTGHLLEGGRDLSPNLDTVQFWTHGVIVSQEALLDPADLLRRHGMQVTAQRLAVLRAVSGRAHSAADEIEELVRADIGAVSRQAVYDALGILTDKGLIRRIQPARSPAQYEIRVDDNHHHLVCRSCGVTVDVDCAVGSAPCLEVADDRGFIVDEAEVIYWGTCPTCQHAARRPRAANDTP